MILRPSATPSISGLNTNHPNPPRRPSATHSLDGSHPPHPNGNHTNGAPDQTAYSSTSISDAMSLQHYLSLLTTPSSRSPIRRAHILHSTSSTVPPISRSNLPYQSVSNANCPPDPSTSLPLNPGTLVPWTTGSRHNEVIKSHFRKLRTSMFEIFISRLMRVLGPHLRT